MKKFSRFLIVLFVLSGMVLGACAGVQAAGGMSKVQAAPLEFTGVIEAIDGNQWVVNGQSIVVDPAVIRDGPFQVGDTVKVEVDVAADGAVTVTRVELPTAADANSNDSLMDDNSNSSNSNDDLFDDNSNSSSNSNDDNSMDDNSNSSNSNDDLFDDNSNGSSNSNDDDSMDDNSNSSNSNDDDSMDDNSNGSSNSNDDDSMDDNSNSSNSNDDDSSNDNSNDDNSNSGG